MNSEKQHNEGKVGIGVITRNRSALFRECINGVPEADVIVVVNDGDAYPATFYPTRVSKVVQHRKNVGVGRSKNDALRILLRHGCSHIFLCEDDIRIHDPDLCRRYIRASEKTGICHFNFGYHGPRNKLSDGTPHPRKVVDYGNGVRIGLNYHLVGAFSYFRSDILRTIGLFDPLYRNMLEHIDHTYRIIREGFHPPFWWFADLADSWRSIDDLDPDLSMTTIKNSRWTTFASFRMSNFYFCLKHGSYVQNLPDVGEEQVKRSLKNIELKNGATNSA